MTYAKKDHAFDSLQPTPQRVKFKSQKNSQHCGGLSMAYGIYNPLVLSDAALTESRTRFYDIDEDHIPIKSERAQPQQHPRHKDRIKLKDCIAEIKAFLEDNRHVPERRIRKFDKMRIVLFDLFLQPCKRATLF
ncbi:hypothetical protein COOONC_14781 [Cooperia oncophora]